MTDRELLELASKAAGIAADIEWAGPNETEGNFYYKGHLYRTWNPLTDDGDALRLAVKLSMFVDTDTQRVNGTYYGAGPDEYAATRRAIVWAAADIGEAMP